MLTTRASVPLPTPTHTTSLPGLWALARDTALESLPSLEMAGHIMGPPHGPPSACPPETPYAALFLLHTSHCLPICHLCAV